MKAEKINLDNAKQDKLVYFVANVVVVRDDGRCLILKRSMREKVHPGKYSVPGGKIEWGMFDLTKPTRMNGDVMDFENGIELLLEKELKEEAGIEVHPEIKYINSVFFVRPDGIPVLLAKFAAKFKSGEVKLEADSFDDFAWVNTEEVKKYDCIQGIPAEVEQAIKLFSK